MKVQEVHDGLLWELGRVLKAEAVHAFDRASRRFRKVPTEMSVEAIEERAVAMPAGQAREDLLYLLHIVGFYRIEAARKEHHE